MTIPISTVLAVGGVWLLSVTALNGRHWWEAWYYCHQKLFAGIGLSKLKSDPMEFAFVLVFCWLIPPAAAGATVWFRHCYWQDGDSTSGRRP